MSVHRVRGWPRRLGIACLWLASAAGCRDTGRMDPAAEVEVGRSDAAARKSALREKEVLDLREQIGTLALSLAHRAADEDYARFDAVPGNAEEFRVRAHDAEMGWVILDAGAGSGVAPGQRFDIYRGERWVARVRTADVRQRVAGAWVEEVKTGWTPEPGDRAVRERRKR